MFLILNFLCRRRKRSPQPVKRRHSSPSPETVKKARKCPKTHTEKKPKSSSKSKEYSGDESDLDVDVDSTHHQNLLQPTHHQNLLQPTLQVRN